jgi:hypothetical protein
MSGRWLSLVEPPVRSRHEAWQGSRVEGDVAEHECQDGRDDVKGEQRDASGLRAGIAMPLNSHTAKVGSNAIDSSALIVGMFGTVAGGLQSWT